MNPQYLFAGQLYRCESEMLNAIAEEWITAGGWNSASEQLIILEGMTDEALARECIEGWQLHTPLGDDEQSHQEACGYSTIDLAKAFARYRAHGPAEDA